MRMYRQWAGSPKGTPELPDRCVAVVPDGGRSPLTHQCRRKRAYGPGGLYCSQHAKRLEQGHYVRVPDDKEVTPC